MHQAIARALIDNGVDAMFGLVGEANLYMTNAYVHEYGGRYVSAAHEAGATQMALGYAGLSGKVGVATVSVGPAMTNTITSLIEGVKGSLPIVLICGDTPGEERDGIQSVPQRDFVIAAGAGFEQLRSSKTVTRDVATALRRAIVERRPIVLNMPAELQWNDTEYEPFRFIATEPSAAAATGDAFDNAIGIIAAARKPVVLAGRGAITPHAKQAMIRLAGRIGAPLATTLKARDLFRGEDFNLGICGTLSSGTAAEILIGSDCIIAFGASLNSLTTSYDSFIRGTRVIQVNADLPDIGRFAPVDAGLVGDPAATADLMVEWLNTAEIPSSDYCGNGLRESLAAEMAAAMPEGIDGDGTVDFMQALWHLERALPIDRVLVTDGGRFTRHVWKHVTTAGPTSFLQTTNYGSIGLGMGCAIGAAAALPDRPIVLLTGDGGFMNGGLAEFNSAVRAKCDLIVVMFNDECYGSELKHLRARGLGTAISLFDWPDFARVATALGGEGYTIRNTTDLNGIDEAITRRRLPLLIDVRIDPALVPET